MCIPFAMACCMEPCGCCLIPSISVPSGGLLLSDSGLYAGGGVSVQTKMMQSNGFVIPKVTPHLLTSFLSNGAIKFLINSSITMKKASHKFKIT